MVLNCRVGRAWPYVALHDLVWPCMALCGLDVAFHGHDYVWPHKNSHGLVCPSMVFKSGLKWSFMAEYRVFSRS